MTKPTDLETINCPDCWARIYLCRKEIAKPYIELIEKIAKLSTTNAHIIPCRDILELIEEHESDKTYKIVK